MVEVICCYQHVFPIIHVRYTYYLLHPYINKHICPIMGARNVNYV